MCNCSLEDASRCHPCSHNIIRKQCFAPFGEIEKRPGPDINHSLSKYPKLIGLIVSNLRLCFFLHEDFVRFIKTKKCLASYFTLECTKTSRIKNIFSPNSCKLFLHIKLFTKMKLQQRKDLVVWCPIDVSSRKNILLLCSSEQTFAFLCISYDVIQTALPLASLLSKPKVDGSWQNTVVSHTFEPKRGCYWSWNIYCFPMGFMVWASCAVAQNAAEACHMKKLSNNHKNLLNHKKCDWRFTRFIHYYPAHWASSEVPHRVFWNLSKCHRHFSVKIVFDLFSTLCQKKFFEFLTANYFSDQAFSANWIKQYERSSMLLLRQVRWQPIKRSEANGQDGNPCGNIVLACNEAIHL